MTPLTSGTPMWVRRVGFFLANVGHWLAGYDWGVDLYARGLRDGLDHPADAAEFLEH